MPGRTTVLANGEIYHVFNRGIASRPIFIEKRNYQRALETLFYYHNILTPIKYSRFLKLSNEEKENILNNLRKEKKFLAEIIAFCFMPNHFHLLLKQIGDNGISKMVSNFTNSYTRYFNTKNEIKGPIFEGKFSSVRIETNEQLLHVSRYIHLNPYTSYVVKTLEELENFPYSSFPKYITNEKDYCFKSIIMENFKNVLSYKKFVFDQAGYQRTLGNIKHLLIES